MTEYNNSNSYPDSIRAAHITVGDVSDSFCNYLYKYVYLYYCGEWALNELTGLHCEIAGWGMTEYNNSNSYPDSVRAAPITVGDVSDSFCNYVYSRVQNST